MTNSTIKISTQQSEYLANLLLQKDYPSAYLYLKNIVESNPNNDQRLAEWLDVAAHVNSNDGSFISDFVRGATIGAGKFEGNSLTDEDFQIASDELAKVVIDNVIKNNKIPELDYIIRDEVQKIVVTSLELQPQAWAGTAIAFIPYFGLDLELDSPFYSDLLSEFRGASSVGAFFKGGLLFQELLNNNLIGLRDATASQLSQAFAAAMDHAEGVLDPANSFLDYVKDLLNGLLDDTQTISDFLQDALNDLLQSQVFVAPARRDPLSLDLDGDGLELVNVNESTAFFDLDVVDNGDGTYTSDGFKEQVGWVKGDDGILTLDKNNNGTIDNILELFGKENKTGTEELREYDLNGDGKIDSQDSIFNQLKVWQDVNQDGVSQSGELKTLSQLGVASINLNNLTTKNAISEGNLIISEGSYTL